ncbi:MAG: hypothetical protein Q7R43_05075 [Candidatus Daviesbacteria bacterium]|nr:hypothetical protein [Candidatus Daviesbacteria bacterium]
MITPQTQIKLNLSVVLKDFLESKARRFGIPMSDYLKHLILRDIEKEEYPVFEASEATKKAYKQALKDLKAGKFVEVDDVDKFFKDLHKK